MLRTLLIIAAVGAACVIVMAIGLQIKPRPFAPFPDTAGAMESVPLPEDLPAPVARFYRRLYGDRVPVITSAVFSGQAALQPVKPFPAFPSRFRFTHDAGRGYRHYIEITWARLLLIKGNEHYLNGRGSLDLGPIGISEGPEIDQAANLGLWAESVWLPALWLTDPRVRWEAVDEVTAVLVVPFEDREEHMVMRFDPDSGMLTYLEAMRYREADEPGKALWICEALHWTQINGHLLPQIGRITWFDHGKPWAVFEVHDVVYNVDVSQYIRQTGP